MAVQLVVAATAVGVAILACVLTLLFVMSR